MCFKNLHELRRGRPGPTAGSSCEKQVPGLDVRKRRYETERFRRSVDQLIRLSALPEFAIQPKLELQALESRVHFAAVQNVNRGSCRTEGTVTLALEPLQEGGAKHHVSRRYIVAQDDAGDIVPDILLGDFNPLPDRSAHHQANLNLVVEQLDVGRPDNRRKGAGERGACLGEDEVRSPLTVLSFRGVIRVVEALAQQRDIIGNVAT